MAQGGRRGFQDGQVDREKLEAARIAFITNRLDLDSETAKVFWPVFNEFEKEKAELRTKYNGQKRELISNNGFKNISDEDASSLLDLYLEQKQAELNLEKKYLGRFKEVLSPQKVWMVVRFDSDFRRSIMQRLGRQGNTGQPSRKRGGNGN